jgi:hypothetical protein
MKRPLEIAHGMSALRAMEKRITWWQAAEKMGAVEKTRDGKVKNPTFPPRLEIPQTPRDSHFPTASATAGDSLEPDISFATKRGHF